MWRRVVGSLVLIAGIAILCYVWLGRARYKSLLPESVATPEVELPITPEPLEGAEESPLQPDIEGDSTLVEEPLVVE